MKVDLHVHTIYSDGEKTPLEILEMCNKNNISTVAITDHGNILGAKKAIKVNPYSHIKVIPGIELTATYPKKGCNLHILGYNVDLENKGLNDISKAIMLDAENRVKSFIKELGVNFNIYFPQTDIDEIFSSVGNIGRPDIAILCVKYGYAKTVREAFKKLLDPLEDKVEKRKVRLTAKECIQYILNAGGVPCLAHPIELKQDINELKEYMAELKGYGLKAVEVYQSKHTREYSEELLEIVNELNLLYSVGSDYHGPNVSPNIEIGSGNKNNLNIEYVSLLSAL